MRQITISHLDGPRYLDLIVHQSLLVVTLSGVKSLFAVGEILRSPQNDTSPKAGRSDKQNALGLRP